jgi:hypothetical protein
MGRRKHDAAWREMRTEELDEELLQCFLASPRRIPEQPHYSRTSIVVVRKELLPFYYAVYDHAVHRFVELQYRQGRNAPLHICPIPPETQPPTAGIT